MNSTWKKVGASLAVVAALAVLIPACAENESSIFIRACLVPNDECAVEPTVDTLTRQEGFLDTKFGGSYACSLLIGNHLAPLGNSALRTETSRVQIYAFEVTIKDAQSGAVLRSYSDPVNGFIDPGQAPSPGYGAVNALLLDVATAEALVNNGGSEVLSTVIARGRTLGGTEVESAPWTMQIGVCRGCTCNEDCTGIDLSDEKLDCQAGRDGHCSFVETSCGP